MRSQSAVTVVIPAYRVSAYVARTVESVLRQTRPAAEIIVVNDGCPDTGGLEQALAPFETHIRYLQQANAGPAAARNTGIRAASADIIAFLDGDDYWAPEFLESQVRYL